MTKDEFEKELLREAEYRLKRARYANSKSSGKLFFSLSSFIQGGLFAQDLMQKQKSGEKK